VAASRREIPVHAAPALSEPVRVPFASLALHPALISAVADRGYTETMPIQTEVIPAALGGGDLIACAETGTGKTAAFVLPILDRLIRGAERGAATDSRRTSVLILTPTRELAVQIEDDILGFAYHTPVSSIAVYGGVPSEPQERALRAGADIVVATPGRLMDHMRGHAADFTGLHVLVLDEADRMMDMGFWPDVRHIVSALPSERQTLLFSATMPPEVVTQANAIVRGARLIAIGASNGPARTITHRIESMPATKKAEWLGQFLKREPGPVLVFARTKRGADRLASRLVAAGVRTAALHADRTQAQRSAALEGLRSGRYTALVATDVAARGLDIEAVTHVINYEVPSTREAYVHRVGRTGRADLVGTAVTLVAPEERKALEMLARDVGIQLRDAGATRVPAGA
jgi:ATP-dependent RNA helicase RhlE